MFNTRILLIFSIILSEVFSFAIQATSIENTKKIFSAKELHSDILKLISASDKPVLGISKEIAADELKMREIEPVAIFNQDPSIIEYLPYDILAFISKSPTSIAGIQPKEAAKEIERRFQTLRESEPDDVPLVNTHNNDANEQEAINKWADNEDEEEMEAFVNNSDEEYDPVKAVENAQAITPPIEQKLKQLSGKED